MGVIVLAVDAFEAAFDRLIAHALRLLCVSTPPCQGQPEESPNPLTAALGFFSRVSLSATPHPARSLR